MSMYFVTGASGVVGSGIVPQIIEQTDAQVLVMLRPKDGSKLESRLDELKKFWATHYPQTAAAIEQRVQAVRGEITEPQLGLDENILAILREQCTNIIHSAASVRMNMPLEEAEKTALYPVNSVIELGQSLQTLKKAEFISTVGVGGRWDGPLPERWIREERQFHNTYEQSKAAAEVKIQEAVESGFPATVHRPSMVVGDSRTGAVIHFQIFYFICEFLSGRRTLGLYPKLGQATLDVVSNDFVAKAVVAAAEDTATAGDIFHLCSGPESALRLVELREIVRRKFRAHGRIGWLPKLDLSRDNFTRVLNAFARLLSERDRRALGTLPIYLDYLTGIQQFGNAASLQKLAERGVPASDNDKVVENALNYYLSAKSAS